MLGELSGEVSVSQGVFLEEVAFCLGCEYVKMKVEENTALPLFLCLPN